MHDESYRSRICFIFKLSGHARLLTVRFKWPREEVITCASSPGSGAQPPMFGL